MIFWVEPTSKKFKFMAKATLKYVGILENALDFEKHMKHSPIFTSIKQK